MLSSLAISYYISVYLCISLYIFVFLLCILPLYITSALPPACSPLESLSSSDDEEVQNITTPKVVLHVGDNDQEQSPDNLPPVLRRAKFRKAASSSPAGSPKVTSPEPSPVMSPRTTPRGSPVNSPRGVRRLIKRGKVSSSTLISPVYTHCANRVMCVCMRAACIHTVMCMRRSFYWTC